MESLGTLFPELPMMKPQFKGYLLDVRLGWAGSRYEIISLPPLPGLAASFSKLFLTSWKRESSSKNRISWEMTLNGITITLAALLELGEFATEH